MSIPFPEPDDSLLELTRTESDVGLLKLIADGKQPWANAAYRVFYDRHKNYMWKVCSNVAVGLNGESWIEDIFNDTFARAYMKAAKFKLPPDAKAGDEHLYVRGWLGKIATRLLQQKLKRFGHDNTRSDDEWRVIGDDLALAEMRAVPDRTLTREQQLIEDAMATLSEREAHVLRVTFQFHRMGERFQRLPNRVTQELATSLATSPENLRKIRERALLKVHQYVETHKND